MERKQTDLSKGQEKAGRNLLCRASFFSGCNHYSQRAYCTKESTCYQKLSHLHLPIQACFLVPPGKSQKRRNGRNRKCFITAEGKSLEYREYRLDVASEYQHLYRSIIVFQEESLQYLVQDQQMAQDLDEGGLIAVTESLLSPGDDKVKFHWCTAHHYLFPTNLKICSSRPSSCAKCKEKRLQKHNTTSRKRKLGSFRVNEQNSMSVLPTAPKRANLFQDLASSLLLPPLNRNPLSPRIGQTGMQSVIQGLTAYPTLPISLSEQLSLLFSAHTHQLPQEHFLPEPSSLYSNVTAAQLVNSINRVCSSSASNLFEDPNWLEDLNTNSTSPVDLVSMISRSCQIRIPTPRYPSMAAYPGLRGF